MIRITKNQIIKMHERLIARTGGSFGIRDEALLDSAISNPFQTFDGIDLYPSVEEKAARLAYGLIRNHPMIDGNKRIGAHSMLVFLEINGIHTVYSQRELYEIILEVAEGKAGSEELIEWIKMHH